MNGETGKVYLVTEENLIPIIKKYLDRITPPQWTRIAVAEWDQEIKATLADMISEIIQTASADVLRIVLPIVQRRIGAALPLQYIKPHLGDSLYKSFSSLFDVVEDQSKDIEELTDMIEEEIKDQVNAKLRIVANTKDKPAKPAVFVTSFVKNAKRLGFMACHAARCLRQFLGRKKPKSQGSPSTGIINNNILSVERVREILIKWYSETPYVTSEDERIPVLPALSPTEITKVATKIVNILMKNMPTHKRAVGAQTRKMSPIDVSDMSLIADEVKNLVFSRSHIHSEHRECRFLKFSKRQFEIMVSDLESEFQTKCDKFILSIRRSSSCPLKCDANNFLLPGCVPESHEPDTSQTRKTKIHLTKGHLSPLDFDSVKSNVEKLFRTFETLDKSVEDVSLESIPCCDQVQMLLKRMTTKLCNHWMPEYTYEFPLRLMGKTLSDSLISTVRRLDKGQSDVSSEETYAIIEDAVRRFFQKMLLWTLMPTGETASSDKVMGVLMDVEKLVREMFDSQVASTPSQDDHDVQNDITEDKNLPASVLQEDMSTKDDLVISKKTQLLQELIPSSPKHTDTSTPEEKSNVTRFSTSSSDHLESSAVTPQSEEMPLNTKIEPADISSSEALKLSHSLVGALLLKLLSKYPKVTKAPIRRPELESIHDRLTNIIMPQMNIEGPERILMEENLEDLVKVLLKDLLRTFGSIENMLKAALSDDSSFDDTLLLCLKYQLLIKKRPRKKNFFRRCLSSISEGLETVVRHLIRKP